ncbi:YbaK/EbsC family protein, partial [Salmonella sp. SKLX063344]
TEKVYTPNAKTIEELVDLFNIDKSRFGKAIVYTVDGEAIVVIIPGDRELNETKLTNYLGLSGHELEMADESIILDISGANKGFTGPIGLKKGTRLIVDSRITKMKNL